VKGPVFLTGLMGSGKTTVGRLLAARLGWAWVDLDQAIEKRAGKKIAQIFIAQGEAAFRALEAKELQRQAKRGHLVISCGGGRGPAGEKSPIASQGHDTVSCGGARSPAAAPRRGPGKKKTFAPGGGPFAQPAAFTTRKSPFLQGFSTFCPAGG